MKLIKLTSKRPLAMLLCVVMVLTMLPATAVAAGAPESFTLKNGQELLIKDGASGYFSVVLDGNTTTVSRDTEIVLKGSGSNLNSNVKVSATAAVQLAFENLSLKTSRANPLFIGEGSKVSLRLAGTNYAAANSWEYAGVRVMPTAALTIGGDGSLSASGGRYAAGMGGDDETGCGAITINSGTITATGGAYGAGIGSGDEATETIGTVTINGGNVTAIGGGEAAGIGSGNDARRPEKIIITDGTVEAKCSGNYGAGIGGGDKTGCGTVEISGGNVTATGGSGAAGIGSGDGGDTYSGDVTISGAGTVVTATGGSGAAGIGSGQQSGKCGTITIKNGKVYATGGRSGAGIGAGYGGAGAVINISGGKEIIAKSLYSAAGIGGNRAVINISGGNVTATCLGIYGTGIGGNDDGGETNITGGTVTATGVGSNSTGIGAVWTRSGGIVNISGENTVVNAKGGQYAAGIGASNSEMQFKALGSDGDNGCELRIWGGADVTATGGEGAAGVGNGSGKVSLSYLFNGGDGYGTGMTKPRGMRSGNVTVSGAGTKLTATGGESAAGIGTGAYFGFCDTFTFQDGATIVATGGGVGNDGIGGGAGIGGGCSYFKAVEEGWAVTSGTVIISGSDTKVYATGRDGGAGIGGGDRGQGSDVTIISGGVIATGQDGGAAIGAGDGSIARSLAISGGTVYAINGIGSSKDNNDGTITITGGSLYSNVAWENGTNVTNGTVPVEGRSVIFKDLKAGISLEGAVLQSSNGTRIPYQTRGIKTAELNGPGTEVIGLNLHLPEGSDFDRIMMTDGTTYQRVSSDSFVFAKASYKVSFDANGGEGTMEPQDLDYGVAKKLRANTFKKTGCTFLGWSTDNAATAAAYADRQSVTKLSDSLSDKSFTLYAVWAQQTKATLSYVPSSAAMGSVSLGSEEITTGAESVKGSTATAKTGYRFVNWTNSRNDVSSNDATLSSAQVSAAARVNGAFADTAFKANFAPHTYTIAFADGTDEPVSGGMSPMDMTYGTAKPLTVNAFTRNGYTFKGWQIEGTSKFLADGATVSNLAVANGAAVTLTAIWEQNPDAVLSYISADMSMGDVGRAYDTIAKGWGAPWEVEAEPATGYHFVSWTLHTKDGKVVSTDALLTPEAMSVEALKNGAYVTTAFVANFAPNSYTVTFDPNGGAGEMSSQPMTYGAAETLCANAYAYDEHTFLGWAADKTAVTALYGDAQSVENLTDDENGTVTLYAVWAANDNVVLSYAASNAAMGTVSPASESIPAGGSAGGSTAAANTGYRFVNWTVRENSVGADAAFTPEKPTGGYTAATYTANFAANTYQIVFDGGAEDGSVSGTMNPMSMAYGNAETLTANRFTRSGYTFAGWYIKDSDPEKYLKNGASVRNLTADDNGTVTLIAMWDKIPDATLSYTPNDINMGATDPTYKKLPGGAGTVSGVTATAATGYHFVNWTVEGAQAGQYDALTVAEIDRAAKVGEIYHTTAFIANFAPNTYTVTFEDDLDLAEQIMTYGRAAALIQNTFEKEGFSFAGWATTPGGAVAYINRQSVENLTDAENGSVTLYAVWTEKKNSIVNYAPANTAHGSVSPMAEAVFGGGTAKGSTAAANPGYHFVNWTDYATGSEVGTETALMPGTVNSAATFVANFAPNAYTIAFDKNGGSGSMENQPMTYGNAEALAANGFTRSGYTFAGWNTQADGLGVGYGDNARVSGLTTGTETVTLYAQWTELTNVNLYYVQSDFAMGKVSIWGEKLNPITGVPVGATATANSGYRFVNWTHSDAVVTTNAALTSQQVDAVAKVGGRYVGTTFRANFEALGGNDSSDNTVRVPVVSDAGATAVSATVSGGTASVSITDKQMIILLDNTKTIGTVSVDLSGIQSATTAKLPAKLVSAAADNSTVSGLTVKLTTGSVTMDQTALGAVRGSDISVSVQGVNTSALTELQKQALGEQRDSAVVVDVSILMGGVSQSSLAGGEITVSVPYTAKNGEDTSNLTVWYIREDGSIQNMGGQYDPKSNSFVFKTTHLSRYILLRDTNPFDDVKNDAYYYHAVQWAAKSQITGGTGASKFSPDGVCTRGQAVTFLWRAMGSPEPGGAKNSFTDVPEDAYYAKAVSWAVENGVTAGTDATTFTPDAACSRSQVVTFLWRLKKTPVVNFAMDFTDVSAGAYYAEAVRWAVSQGITSGTSPMTFSPNGNCSRAQIVTFLYRCFVN